MSIYTEGICGDGAAILKDGVRMTITEVLQELNQSAGNTACDSCGNYITPDDINFGHECDICENCANR